METKVKDIVAPPPGFDEANYLALNADVAVAVKNGKVPSGWIHALLHGYREGRKGVSADVASQLQAYWVKVEQTDSDRVPPSNLRARVHGSTDFQGFHLVGARVASDIQQTLNQMNIAVPHGANVLDFGCGCGRVISHLVRGHPDWKFFGSDIDKEAIGWCRAHLSDLADFSANNEMPPSHFSDNFFDFIYSISVFTHLPEDMQFSWLEELCRITKPGGVLFLTTHGIDLLSANLRDQAAAAGFYYGVGRGTEGLPEFYQTTYHSHEYIKGRWSKYFDVISISSKAINAHQDLVFCKKKASDN